jgi:hypothetical protein
MKRGPSLALASADNRSSVAGVIENIADVVPPLSLREYFDAVQEKARNRFTTWEAAEPAILDSLPALRAEVSGQQLKGYVYVVKGRTAYVTFIAVTDGSKFETHAARLRQIVESARLP